MKYQQQHEAFKKLVIQQGICKLEQLRQALPFGYSIPQRLVDKWLNGILTLPKGFSSQRRYVNRFKLGADPEFLFVDDGVRINAHTLGLQQGLAYGMDNNGRLTEIRPYPSRSALEVTASILVTLRLMAAAVPATMSYEWWAGAYLMDDGLGGHVHFGRKRPGRDLEVKALDAIEEEMLAVKAYPFNEVMRRRQGDAHHQIYGALGDIRLQEHGYEYRTFPSWLDSPELAFLTMTLSKLAVHNPSLVQGYPPLIRAEQYIQRIKNLLAYYKDIDDDARLALTMISKKFPLHVGGDFKKRWSIGVGQVFKVQNLQYIPSSLKPSVDETQEMFEYLAGNKALENRAPALNWTPLAPPPNYIMALSLTTTFAAKGLGELLRDVCCHKQDKLVIQNSREMQKKIIFSIPETLAATLPIGWQKFCQGRMVTHIGGDPNVIYSSEKSREPDTFKECRRLLLETVLPFWSIHKIKSDSWEQWQSARRIKPAEKFVGKMLYGTTASLPMRELR